MSKRPASTGSQPAAWVASTSIWAPWSVAAALMASKSARVPSDDWTADTATIVVPARTASASRPRGASRTRTPLPTWARNGKLTDVNSPSATRTSLPGGRAAATSPTNGLTTLPIATEPASTPTRPANAVRARSTESSNPTASERPLRQSARVDSRAAMVRRGGRPSVAVLQYTTSGSNSPRASSGVMSPDPSRGAGRRPRRLPPCGSGRCRRRRSAGRGRATARRRGSRRRWRGPGSRRRPGRWLVARGP